MVKSSIEHLLDTPLDDFGNNNSNNSFGWSRGRGRGGVFKRGAGSWRGRGTRGRTYVSGLASNIPSTKWRESSLTVSTDLQSNWRGSERRLTSRRSTEERPTRATKRRRKAPPVISTAGEIIVTGLDSSITSDDIRDIFSKRIGVATKAYVVFDKSGKSKGEAHVTFAKKSDAKKAVEKLDEAIVDDKKIRVRVLTSNGAGMQEESSSSEEETRRRSVSRPRSSRSIPSIRKGRGFVEDARPARPTMSRRPSSTYAPSSFQSSRSRLGDIPPDVSNPLDRANTLQMNGPIGRGRARGRGGYRGTFRGRARGRGGFSNRGRGGGGSWDEPPVTAEDLDRDLESYLN